MIFGTWYPHEISYQRDTVYHVVALYPNMIVVYKNTLKT